MHLPHSFPLLFEQDCLYQFHQEYSLFKFFTLNIVIYPHTHRPLSKNIPYFHGSVNHSLFDKESSQINSKND